VAHVQHLFRLVTANAARLNMFPVPMRLKLQIPLPRNAKEISCFDRPVGPRDGDHKALQLNLCGHFERTMGDVENP
jgi:hypothetical protein